MNEEYFRSEAKSHLIRIVIWFCVFFGSWVVLSSIALWAEKQRGWEAEFVEVVFWLLGGICGLGALMFGIMIFGYFRSYKKARRDLNHYKDDPETFRRIYNDVLGPIPWGFRRD